VLNCLDGLESRDRVKELQLWLQQHWRNAEYCIESGVHLFIRVIRGRVLYDRDLVAELDGIANLGFDAGMS
jgi:hypothetical protein